MSKPRVVVAPNSGPFTLSGTQTYIVGDREVAVIDPGPDLEDHIRAVQAAVSHADTVTILLTHRHSDHAGGAPALGRLLDAPVLGTGPGALRPFSPDERISTDRGELSVVPTPGHSAGHVAFYWQDTGALFAGDLLLGRGDTTWLGEYPGCVADYLSSLERVEALGPDVIYPAHGPPILDPVATVREYRAHRLARIQEVAEARAAHPEASAIELAELVYGDTIPERLKKDARRTAEAILHHLDHHSG